MAGSRPSPSIISGAAAAFTCAAGSIVLLGWLLDADALKRVVPLPSLVTVKANSGVSFVLAGVALWLLRKDAPGRAACNVARGCGVVVAIIGLATLLEYLLGLDLGVDQALFHERPGQPHTVDPGRIAPSTATAYVLIGVAFALFDAQVRGRYRLANGLAGVAACVGLLVLIGYVSQVNAVPGLASTWMPQMTAMTIIVLAIGVVAARPQRGIVALLASPGPGGVAGRRLLPVALTLPVLVGFLRFQAERHGLLDPEVGVWLLLVSTVFAFSVLIVVLASSLERGDRERRQAEQVTAEARLEAEGANRAKSELLSRMSHELRTPLNAILGFGQLLEMECTDRDRAEEVGQILKSGRHLLSLIDVVLDISRIDAGTMALSLEPVRTGDVIGDALELAAPLAAERGIRLEPPPDTAIDRYVRADVQRLKQVLLNLLSNAIKYNREGGRVSLNVEEAADRLRIVVLDTGPGIPAEHLDEVFTPFQRLAQDTAAIDGAGLGLALSKRLVEAMGGELGVISERGVGSTFWVVLPPATPVAAPAPDPARGAGGVIRPGAAGTVLSIEDNLSNIKLLERLLAQRPGVHLIATMQGNLGIELAREHQPDLVLLDLHLPDLPGDEVLRRLRAEPATAQTPVVVVSADATERQKKRLLDAGAQAYLTKPLDIRELLAVVDDLVRPSVRAG
jgi:signal transduction histidine kinase/ActR/RegA family two-component response regulator